MNRLGGEVYRPAAVVFVHPSRLDSSTLMKGVPQIDTTAALQVSETYHAPPANAVVSAYSYIDHPQAASVPLVSPTRARFRPKQTQEVEPANACTYW
tara:strand:- start:2088 stop:2378 length:291 start_codon:yes stop_codon:yes gene_type:complete